MCAQDLENPHIVRLYDYLEKPSDIFLIMEYCNGGDLGDYLLGGCGYQPVLHEQMLWIFCS